MIQLGPEIWVSPGYLVVLALGAGLAHQLGPTALGVVLLESGQALGLVIVVVLGAALVLPLHFTRTVEGA
jgi:hypothetical protein